MNVDESLAEIRKKKEEAEDNKRDTAKMPRDKKRATEEIHRLELIITQGVKNQEMLKSKLVKFNIDRKVIEKKLAKLKPQGASSPAAASASGAGRFKLKTRAKAKARLKPIMEDEEEIRTVIKPARNHLPYLDLNNDPYLINKIR